VSFKIIMTSIVTRPCVETQHQTCKTKTKTDFFRCQTGLVLRPTVSDHITNDDDNNNNVITIIIIIITMNTE